MIEYFKNNKFRKVLKNLWKKIINGKSITVYDSKNIIIVFNDDGRDYIYPSTDIAAAKRKIKELETQIKNGGKEKINP